jgi:hypothetical protein
MTSLVILINPMPLEGVIFLRNIIINKTAVGKIKDLWDVG